MPKRIGLAIGFACVVTTGAASLLAQTGEKPDANKFDDAAAAYAKKLLDEGKEIFRHDTFGSENFWGGTLKVHQAIMGEKLGGIGAASARKRRWNSASR
jgi:hypothetical protein